MAECRVCGKVDNSLPAAWVAWECILCFKDLFMTIDGFLLDSEYNAQVIKDFREKREMVNQCVVDAELNFGKI